MSGAIDPADRGLAYGDGLFETMRAHRGTVPWWDAHWARLERGAGRLRLPLPDPERARREARALLESPSLNGRDAVLKLLLTRGPGGRGYVPPAAPEPTLLLSVHDLPPTPPAEGLVLRWCDTRLAVQPALAGLKHCNRLEQVLARMEWSDPAIHEGLMRSIEGDAVCATAANLFVLRDGAWFTPPVDRCGVAGVCRAWAIDALGAVQSRLSADEVETAESVFLCNAVRGILPVARLGARRWAHHPAVAALRARLAAEVPGWAC